MMAAVRTLTSAERATAEAVARRGVAVQRAYAERIDPEAFQAWQGWVWGRRAFRLSTASVDAPPARVRVLLRELRATEYIASKRDPDGKSRRVLYRHEHDAPFASVVSTADGAPDGAERSSRGAPAFRGPALFELGALYALEGLDESGAIVRWRAPAGVLLCGCPYTDTMHVIRSTAEARRAAPPVWIMRGRSRYTLTDRGIER